MDSALVIAGNSFVGRHLCDRLARDGIPFHRTSRSLRADFLTCDLTRGCEVDALLAEVRPRWIFSCAGLTAPTPVREMVGLHVMGSQTLLWGVARHVPDAVTVLFGSAAEYGNMALDLLPIREDAPARPETAYGGSKLAQFQMAQGFAERHNLRVHVVRPFNVLGRGVGGHLVAGALCERLWQARTEGRRGALEVANGHATRDWVDVRDVVDAVVRLAIDAPPIPGHLDLYNIATGIETPVLTLADHLCRLAGEFHVVDAGPDSACLDRSCGDATKVREATGWLPCFTWQESAETLWQSFEASRAP